MCSVMYTINVLTPRGRLQQVKVTPNTTLLQVLEEVCTKHGFNAIEYDLSLSSTVSDCSEPKSTDDADSLWNRRNVWKNGHHNQILDVSSMFRFTSLPNNAQLEMTEATKLRQESSVMLGLQLETGERLTGIFTPSDTIWHVIITLKPEEEKMSNLVVIYMRREIYGRDTLSSTTLKSLGLTSGRAMLRLLHKSPEELRTQANVTSNLIPRNVPSHITEEKINKTELSKASKKNDAQSDKADNNKRKGSLEKTKTQSQPVTSDSAQSSTKYTKSENYNFKGNVFEKLIKEEKARRAALNENSEPKVELMNKKKEVESSISKKGNPGQTQKVTQRKNSESEESKKIYEKNAVKVTNEEKEDSSKVILLGSRNAVAYNLNSIKPTIFEEEPDDFYELTINDAKMLLKDAKQLCADLENVPLMTAAQRELEKDKKFLTLLHQYKKTVLRIKFPDRTVLQGTFSPLETIAEVEKFVASYLEDPKLKFYLYTTPPKVTLKPSERLIECECVPSSVLYLGLPENVSAPKNYLKSEVLNKLSTPSAAALTAFQSRQMEKTSNQKSEEKEKRKWTRGERNEDPGPSGSKQWQKTSNDEFKCPKWFKPNK